MSKQCSKCGREFGFLEDDFNGLCYDCNQEINVKNLRSNNAFIENPIAQKFTTVTNIIKILGYSLAIIVGFSAAIGSEFFLVRN